MTASVLSQRRCKTRSLRPNFFLLKKASRPLAKSFSYPWLSFSTSTISTSGDSVSISDPAAMIDQIDSARVWNWKRYQKVQLLTARVARLWLKAGVATGRQREQGRVLVLIPSDPRPFWFFCDSKHTFSFLVFFLYRQQRIEFEIIWFINWQN